VPGFSAAYVSAVGVQVGVRETRRIAGRARLNADELRRGRRGVDDIAEAAWPFEVHDSTGTGTRLEWLPDDLVYQIPLGAALPCELDNVAVAGRCISTTSEAHASTRVMGTCFAAGEAVGWITAAQVSRRAGVIQWRPGILDPIARWRTERRAPPDASWPPAPHHRR
jgi:hypothetical protein